MLAKTKRASEYEFLGSRFLNLSQIPIFDYAKYLLKLSVASHWVRSHVRASEPATVQTNSNIFLFWIISAVSFHSAVSVWLAYCKVATYLTSYLVLHWNEIKLFVIFVVTQCDVVEFGNYIMQLHNNYVHQFSWIPFHLFDTVRAGIDSSTQMPRGTNTSEQWLQELH